MTTTCGFTTFEQVKSSQPCPLLAIRKVHECAMIVALLNQTGGVGKTTLTLRRAGAWARQGKRVTLIDADPQGSALDWSEQCAKEGRPSFFGVIGLCAPRSTGKLPSSRETPVTSSSTGRRASPD